MFRSYRIYIQIRRNKVTVANLDTGAEASIIANVPFSTTRSVLSKFSPANETILAAFRELGIKTSFVKIKVVIQQMEDTDGGLTDIEKRALRDLAENAGAGKVYIVDNERHLSNSEALAFMRG
jgi:hypothetical protein